MVDSIPQTVSIHNSTLIDVQGNQYYYNHSSVGEYGIQELFKVSCPAALHNSRERYPPPRCLEGTRVTVLDEIYGWIYLENEPILWLSGPAGSGKSAIAQTIAEKCEQDGILASTFFFFRGALGRDEPKHLVPTISFQLVLKFSEKRVELGNLIENNPLILHKPMDTQFKTLVLPFFATPSSESNPTSYSLVPYVVIVDGLDECGNENDQREIVRCIGQLVNGCAIPVRVIVISRPEPHIMESFDCLHSLVRCKSLYRPGDKGYIEETEQDIYTYLRHEFDRIYREHNLKKEEYWPGDNCLRELVQRSYTGIFIYGSTVIKYVDDHDYYPVERLDEVLNQRGSSKPSPFSDLDALYTHILGGHKNRGLLLRVLIPVCCSFGWMNEVFEDGGLAQLLQIEEGKVSTALRYMHSVLNPKTLNFYHTSFRDFIFSQERAGQYYIDEREGHASMAQLTLDHISGGDTDSKAYRYSICEVLNHLSESGPWGENLLKAMATILDSKGAKDVEFYFPKSQALFWRRFKIDEDTPTNLQNNLIYLRDRLFKLWWKRKITIVVLYERCSLRDLRELGLDKISSSKNGEDHIPFHKHVGSGPNDDKRTLIADEVVGYDPESTLMDLVLKRIHENHRSDARFICRGHAEIISSWLRELAKPFPGPEWSGTPHSKAYSYRRKYWTRHLSQVPLGNDILLKSLKRHTPSDFMGRLTTDELQSLMEWLKASRPKIQEYSPLGSDKWCENMDEIDDDDDEVIDWVEEGSYYYYHYNDF